MQLTSIFAHSDGYPVKKIAKNSGKNPYDRKHIINSLGANRRDLIDCMSIGTYDASMSTADKIAKMDQKLDKLCRHFDIQA